MALSNGAFLARWRGWAPAHLAQCCDIGRFDSAIRVSNLLSVEKVSDNSTLTPPPSRMGSTHRRSMIAVLRGRRRQRELHIDQCGDDDLVELDRHVGMQRQRLAQDR